MWWIFLILLGLASAQEITMNKTCLNTTPTSGSCLDTNVMDGIYYNESEMAVSPGFQLIMNITNNSIALQPSIQLTIYGQYSGSTSDNVSVALWNGTAYNIMGYMPANANNFLDILNINTSIYNIGNRSSIRFLHSNMGNPSHNGLVLDYVAFHINTDVRADITYPTQSTYGPGQCWVRVDIDGNTTIVDPYNYTCKLDGNNTQNFTGTTAIFYWLAHQDKTYNISCTVADENATNSSWKTVSLIGTGLCPAPVQATRQGDPAFLYAIILVVALCFLIAYRSTENIPRGRPV